MFWLIALSGSDIWLIATQNRGHQGLFFWSCENHLVPKAIRAKDSGCHLTP